jgi:hypothetical protein
VSISEGGSKRVPPSEVPELEPQSVPRGTLAMVNMRGYEGLGALTVALSLVA